MSKDVGERKGHDLAEGSAASERDRALRDRAIANTFEGKNVMEPRADVPVPDAAWGRE